MFCVQAKYLAPGLHNYGSENRIVDIQPMAGLPAPIQCPRCVNVDGEGMQAAGSRQEWKKRKKILPT